MTYMIFLYDIKYNKCRLKIREGLKKRVETFDYNRVKCVCLKYIFLAFPSIDVSDRKYH